MTRICFEFQVDPEELESYLEYHQNVWPEMLAELHEAGMQNYSIFHAGQGRMVGYYETANPTETNDYLSKSEVAARWDTVMQPMFQELPGGDNLRVSHLNEIFNLEAQLGS